MGGTDSPERLTMSNTAAVREYLLGLQQRIVDAMEPLDGGRFVRDGWTRAPGERLQGDGLTRCIDDGLLLERGGCNFSHVRGAQLPPSATQVTRVRVERPRSQAAAKSCLPTTG